MKLDSFTISRLVFIIFILVVSVYFIVENKRSTQSTQSTQSSQQKVERFENNTATTAAPTTLASSESAKALSSKQPEPGSTVYLSGKDKQATDPKAPLPDTQPEYLGKDEIQDAIHGIYKELYKSSPSQEELEFYMEYASSRKITRDQLKEVVETSAPTLQKTFYSRRYADTPDEIFGKENEIIEVFNELLMRNPDKIELYDFAKMLAEDKSFTLDKLRQILIASEEFKRMEKTQNNRVYVNLQSNITDRQLTMQVTKIYADISGKKYLDEDTLKFLKKKFVEFELNERKLQDFILNYINNKPYKPVATTTSSTTAAGSAKAASAASTTSSSASSTAQQSPAKTTSTAPAATASTAASSSTSKKAAGDKQEDFEDGKNIYNDSQIFNIYSTEGVNKDVIAALMAKGTAGDGSVDTGKLINKIKDNPGCVINRNAAEMDMLQKNKQELADYINERNMSHLKNVCIRNKKYINADEDMVLYPEFQWSVPQAFPPVCMGGENTVNPMVDQTALIGTLLPDATNTSVGSILPVYPPV